MLKKFFKVFICMCLLIQNFLFIIKVIAQENDEISIDIVSIKQGDNILELKNGKYEVSGLEELTLNYKINNLKDNKHYNIKIENNNIDINNFSVHKDFANDTFSTKIYLDSNFQENEYMVKVCELNNNWECINEVAEKRFILNFIDYNNLDYLHSKLVITKVEQGGKEIIPTIYYWGVKYNLNSVEDVEITFVGENLADKAKYQFYNNFSFSQNFFLRNEKIEYTGAEIKKGIKHIIPLNILSPKGIQMVLNLDVYKDNVETSYKTNDGRYIPISFEFNENDLVDNTKIKIKHQSEELSLETNEEVLKTLNGDVYKITPNKYNKEKTLTLNIATQSLEDKDYETEIFVYKKKEKLFSKKTNISGLNLNNGYDINLDNFVLEMPTDINDNLGEYQIYVKINNVTKKINLLYKENGKLTPSLFYNNGEKTILRQGSWGGILYNGGTAFTINKKAFSEYNKMYFHYLGTDFENDTTYNYEFYYGENEKNKKLVTKGTIVGKELNENGILQTITDNNDYMYPVYMFVVKKGDNLVYYDNSELLKINDPTLTTIKLTSNNKNIYMQMSDYKYVATKNAPLTILVDGIGFDENKNYKCNLYDSYNGNNIETYTFSGKDINNGTAYFKISEGKEGANLRNISLEIIEGEDYSVSWGDIEIEYVNSKEYFPTNIPYVIDNAKDLIKNIKKETNVNKFISSLNRNVKVYDNTGKKEINGNVGTGMIARIIDKYNNSIMDLDVVVKGDVNGDGNISITDLVKVKRHLANVDKLTGIYELGGDITDTGKITITDLVKISRDIANIQEVK